MLLNKYNQVIGITYATYDAEDSQNINYAINVKYANELKNKYNSKEYNEVNTELYSKINFINRNFKLFYLDFSFLNNENYYSVVSNEVFYTLTNKRGRFEFVLDVTENNWENIYNSLSNDNKNEVIEKAKTIFNKLYNNNIANNITIEEMILRLKVLEEYQYSILLVDLSRYDSLEKQIERLNSYELTDGQKLFLKCTICDYNWNLLSNNNKEILFDYICSLINNINDKKAVLELFGYEVKLLEDGSLKAYWN